MPQPNQGSIYVNVPLTNIATIYYQDQSRYIADKVFPLVPVQLQGGLYWRYKKDDFLRNDVQKRAAGSESAGTGWNNSTDGPYFCDVYALHKDISEQEVATSMLPMSLDMTATQFLMQQMLIKRDVDWSANYFTTSKWTGGSGGATDQTGVASAPGANQFLQWNNANSTPIVDIQTQRTAIEGSTGFVPNKLVITPQVKLQLVNNPSVLDRIKYVRQATGLADDLQLLAAAFGVEQVLEAAAVYNSAKEGDTASFGFVFPKAALLVYTPPAPSIMVPSAGYTFSWAGLLGGSAFGIRMKSFYLPWLESTRVEAEMSYSMQIVASDLGCFFTSCVA